MQFQPGQLVAILGCSTTVENKWIDAINAACAKYSIDTKLRLAAFIAQVGHESARLTAVSENLNYSASGLLSTWPNRFTAALAAACARQPEKIANVVYSSRLGNGNTDSGDGWKYRGRGLIQCTGKSNYNSFSQSCGVDAVSNPDSLADPANAALSAAWFWNSKNLNAYADRQDFLGTTKLINGGTIGQADREALYKTALIVLGGSQLPKTDEELAATPVPQDPAKVTAPASVEPTPAAQNSTIIEPRAVTSSTGKSLYPWNLTFESRSGHYTEIDDTPGYERLNMTHRTGSYWEIDPTGVFTHKSVLDSYSLTKEDSYAYTGGNHTSQVQGQSYNQVGGEASYRSGGNFYISAPRIQMNTGLLAVSGVIEAPFMHANIFESPYANTLAKVAMVAWDLGGGSGGSGVSGGEMQAAGNPVIGGSFGFNGTPATEALRTNNLASKDITGAPVVTNGINVVTAAAAAVGATAAAGVAQIMKDNDLDPSVANAMTSAAADIDSSTGTDITAAAKRTPVFLKHVAFDKPTLLSQSTLLNAPDPSLYFNNIHTIVDSSGVGNLYMSDGISWNLIKGSSEGGGTGDVTKEYVDGQISGVNTNLGNEIINRGLAITAEGVARDSAILATSEELQQTIINSVLAESQNRDLAIVTAEADILNTADQHIASLKTELLTGSIHDNAAAIITTNTAIADVNRALSERIDAFAAGSGDNNFAAVYEKITAETGPSSALASRIDSLISNTVDSNNFASVYNTITTQTGPNSAIVTSIANITAANGPIQSAITSQATVTTNEINGRIATQATQTTTQISQYIADAIGGTIHTNITSAISDLNTTLSNADLALGSRITAITATNGPLDSAVTTLQQAIVNASGASATYTNSVASRVASAGKAINSDPFFTDPTQWLIRPNAQSLFQFTSIAGYAGDTAAYSAIGQLGRSLSFPVQGGKKYRISLVALNQSGARVFYARMLPCNANGSEQGNDLQIGLEGVSPPVNVWTPYTADWTCPAGLRYACLAIWINWGPTEGNPAIQYIQNYRIEEVTDAASIEASVSGIQSTLSTQNTTNIAQAITNSSVATSLAVTKNYTIIAAGSGSNMIPLSGVYNSANQIVNTDWGRSWNTFGLLPDGSVYGFTKWDVYAGAADALANAVAGNPYATFTAFATFDEPTTGINANLIAQLLDYGATKDGIASIQYRGAYILLGYKGAGEGGGIEYISPYSNHDDGETRNWVKATMSVVNGWPVGLTGPKGAVRANAATATILNSAIAQITDIGNGVGTSALVQQVSALNTYIGQNGGSISQISSISSTASTALANAGTAQDTANNALSKGTQGIGDAANAYNLANTANGTANTATSNLGTLANQVNASYTVSITTNVNGIPIATGFKLQSNGVSSQFVVLVDNFAIAANNGSGGFTYPFSVQTLNGVSQVNINGPLLASAINAQSINIGASANGNNADYFIRTNNKGHDETINGFATSFNPATGVAYTAVTSGSGAASSGARWHSNGDFRLWGPGFNLNPSGLTISQLDVIGTSNIAGEGVTLSRVSESTFSGVPGTRYRVHTITPGFDSAGYSFEFKFCVYSGAGALTTYTVDFGDGGTETRTGQVQGVQYWVLGDGIGTNGELYTDYAITPASVDVRKINVPATYRTWYVDMMIQPGGSTGFPPTAITRSIATILLTKR